MGPSIELAKLCEEYQALDLRVRKGRMGPVSNSLAVKSEMVLISAAVVLYHVYGGS